jgi:hypothetical protein
MKTLHTLAFCVFVLSTSAQNWSSINTIRHAHFEPAAGWGTTDYLGFNIAIDSVTNLGNAVRLFNAPTIELIGQSRDPTSSFFKKDTTWMGPHCLQENGRVEHYFNANGNSITFETAAPMNNALDSLECLLTKNYGWLSTVGFSNFPDTLSAFQLIGFSAPEFGENDVTFSDVYDFQIGDIIHYEARKNGFFSFGFDQVTFDARHVIGIQFSTNGDTLSIDYDRNFYYRRYPLRNQ